MPNDRSRQEPTFGVYPTVQKFQRHLGRIMPGRLQLRNWPTAAAPTCNRICRKMPLLRSEYDRRRTKGLYTVDQNEDLMFLGESFYHAVMPIAVRIGQIHPALSRRPS